MMTQEEVAELFGVSIHTIRKWRQAGLIPFVRVGQTVRFEDDAIKDFIARHRQAGQEPAAAVG